jgi:hypothetical protein
LVLVLVFKVARHAERLATRVSSVLIAERLVDVIASATVGAVASKHTMYTLDFVHNPSNISICMLSDVSWRFAASWASFGTGGREAATATPTAAPQKE